MSLPQNNQTCKLKVIRISLLDQITSWDIQTYSKCVVKYGLMYLCNLIKKSKEIAEKCVMVMHMQ